MTDAALRDALDRHLIRSLGIDPAAAGPSELRRALALVVRDRIAGRWIDCRRRAAAAAGRRVNYLSMEFLIGRLLEDALVNLGLRDTARAVLAERGVDLASVEHDEPDAALGNGGLGRLAACFMESLATLEVPAFGYGIRYEHGLFRQSFAEGRQMEAPEDWLDHHNTWEFRRPDRRVPVSFGGQVVMRGGRSVWEGAETVIAQAWDTPVIGWGGGWANTLRLWSAEAVQGFDLARFNSGDHVGAAEGEAAARAISRVLYPDDSTEIGRELRLRQEYFFTAASLRDILRRAAAEGVALTDLPRHAAVQLNDTHPAIAGPELVRLLHDEGGLPLASAIETARATLSYTNHTLLPEALERWSEALMSRLLPRHMQLIERIDAAHAARHPTRSGALVQHGEVSMGELAFVMAHKVNGVSALHTELMKETVFAELHRLHPDRIVNQTNGVTPRRWLNAANPRLAGLISGTIGPDWVGDLDRLADLEPHLDDTGFLDAYGAVKLANKTDLANWMAAEHGVRVDPAALFDVQIKRIHEYKRQHLNILEAIALWQAIKADPQGPWVPRVKIIAGKAAPGYHFAKEIIRLINDVAAVINADPETAPLLQVVYLPNYNVTLAERLIPASDLSEQISTAGKEASGTGNMKFALNGAPTIGTLDGANVEIRDRVGAENFFLFGMTAAETVARRMVPHHARQALEADTRLSAALRAISNGEFSPRDRHRYRSVVGNLAGHDYFLVCSDFTAYWDAQRRVDAAFADPDTWWRIAARNTARCGWFSSDRTIRGYLADIWKAGPLDAG